MKTNPYVFVLFIFYLLTQLLLVAFKLADIITWSWIQVFYPTIVPGMFCISALSFLAYIKAWSEVFIEEGD